LRKIFGVDVFHQITLQNPYHLLSFVPPPHREITDSLRRFEMEFHSTLVSIVQHRISVTTIVVHVAVSGGSLSDIKIRTWCRLSDLATSNPTSSLGFHVGVGSFLGMNKILICRL
jgi:hypothetical protein